MRLFFIPFLTTIYKILFFWFFHEYFQSACDKLFVMEEAYESNRYC